MFPQERVFDSNLRYCPLSSIEFLYCLQLGLFCVIPFLTNVQHNFLIYSNEILLLLLQLALACEWTYKWIKNIKRVQSKSNDILTLLYATGLDVIYKLFCQNLIQLTSFSMMQNWAIASYFWSRCLILQTNPTSLELWFHFNYNTHILAK